MKSIQDNLQRMHELVIQGANDTCTQEDRGKIQKELDQFIPSIDDIAKNTPYNGINLLDGTQSKGTVSSTATNVSVSVSPYLSFCHFYAITG